MQLSAEVFSQVAREQQFQVSFMIFCTTHIETTILYTVCIHN